MLIVLAFALILVGLVAGIGYLLVGPIAILATGAGAVAYFVLPIVAQYLGVNSYMSRRIGQFYAKTGIKSLTKAILVRRAGGGYQLYRPWFDAEEESLVFSIGGEHHHFTDPLDRSSYLFNRQFSILDETAAIVRTPFDAEVAMVLERLENEDKKRATVEVDRPTDHYRVELEVPGSNIQTAVTVKADDKEQAKLIAEQHKKEELGTPVTAKAAETNTESIEVDAYARCVELSEQPATIDPSVYRIVPPGSADVRSFHRAKEHAIKSQEKFSADLSMKGVASMLGSAILTFIIVAIVGSQLTGEGNGEGSQVIGNDTIIGAIDLLGSGVIVV